MYYICAMMLSKDLGEGNEVHCIAVQLVDMCFNKKIPASRASAASLADIIRFDCRL